MKMLYDLPTNKLRRSKMIRSAKLIFVGNEHNNNKFYNMTDNGSTISVEYGRVGAGCQTASYPSSNWTKLLNSKTKKGYKDVTHLFTEAVSGSTVSFHDISDKFVSDLIRKLEGYTKQQVSTNYLVTADSVTEKQIKEAQSLLDALAGVKNNRELNQLLLEIFSVIPRKMKKVQDHLFGETETFKYSVAEKIISTEQDLLDAMSQQVNQVELVADNKDDKLTLLDAMGLEIYNISAADEALVKGKCANLKDNFMRAFKVVNKKTQKKFDTYVAKVADKKRELFWHGSRNENWLPILQTGLVLRPTNAVISGKMFGYGTYFADKAQKSWGYTSARGSYWAQGNASEAYMALFDVHLGKQLHIKRHESWCSSLDRNRLRARGDYDSLFAEGGIDLRNNEFIIYEEDQSTIQFIVQFKG
jgi:poly [ADP-ribose] polymerase